MHSLSGGWKIKGRNPNARAAYPSVQLRGWRQGGQHQHHPFSLQSKYETNLGEGRPCLKRQTWKCAVLMNELDRMTKCPPTPEHPELRTAAGVEMSAAFKKND